MVSILDHYTFCLVIPGGIYLLKVNNRNTRTRCEICSNSTIKTPKRRQWRRFGVFIVNFENISHLVVVFLLSTLTAGRILFCFSGDGEEGWWSETVARRCSVKKVFLENLPNPQENACSYRTLPVDAFWRSPRGRCYDAMSHDILRKRHLVLFCILYYWIYRLHSVTTKIW